MKTPRRTFLKQSAALGAAATVAGFPAIAQSQSGPVKIGIVHPVTGFLAYSGNLCRVGAKLAVDEINAGGGVLGRKLRLVTEDDQSKPGEAAIVVRALQKMHKNLSVR